MQPSDGATITHTPSFAHLLCPSNFRMIVSINVFWGATCPRRTGMLSSCGPPRHRSTRTARYSYSTDKVLTLTYAERERKRETREKKSVDTRSQTVMVLASVFVHESWPICYKSTTRVLTTLVTTTHIEMISTTPLLLSRRYCFRCQSAQYYWRWAEHMALACGAFRPTSALCLQ